MAEDDDIQVVEFKTPKTAKKRATLKAFGGEWTLIRPNQIKAGRLVDHDGDINAGYVNDYLMAHIDEKEREAFLQAAEDEPGLDVEALLELMETMTEAVYEKTPS